MELLRFVLANLLFLSVNCLSFTQQEWMANELGSCPTIVSRADWHAKPPKGRTPLNTPVPYIILHHTDWDECFDFDTCAAMMRKIQDFHQQGRGWNDIGYNFCVGEDGRVYEGRGWDTVGAHAPWYNFHSIGICMMGNFDKKVPNRESINAVFSLIKCTVEKAKVMSNYTLYGHRQVRDTTCPGDDLFAEIQSWPHWKPGKHYPPIEKKSDTLEGDV